MCLAKESRSLDKKKAKQVSEPPLGVRANVPSHLWAIHGKFYDLKEFVKRHPGGETFILLGQGRECTELFEGVHAMHGEGPKKILAKYEVQVDGLEPPKDIFKWEENGFYRTLSKRVRAYFDENTGGNYKMTPLGWFKIAFFLSLYLTATYLTLQGHHLAFAFLMGLMVESTGFCVMHDGSHGALTYSPFANILGTLYSSWMLWEYRTWLVHHCYGHHSYTGVYGNDPDLINSKIFLRKHPKSKKMPRHRYQHLYVWFIMMFAPDQHLGQAIQYRLALARRRVFGVPLHAPLLPDTLSVGFFALGIVSHVLLPLYYLPIARALAAIMLSFSAMGMSYFYVVLPNHDQEETFHNHFKVDESNPIDWGEQQVRASGNHCNSDSLKDQFITQAWGGMNYQIEHHLFPSISHMHFPAISKIVQKTAKEFDIPYRSAPTWRDAIGSGYRLMKLMASWPAEHRHSGN